MKICSKCKKEKPESSFRKDKSKKTGLSSHCKSCGREYDKKRSSARSDEYVASSILGDMTRRARRKGFPPPEWSRDEILEKIKNGKCEVTNRSFDVRYKSKYFHNPFNISPDRIDSSKGYTKQNVRWVCTWVNYASNQYDLDDFISWIRGCKWK